MSEICEHPFCTRSIFAKCSNHCQLELCEEHTIEHKNLFLIQYEKSFTNLTKSLNELIHSIEEKRTNLNIDYQKDISSIDETYRNKLNELDEKSLLISSTQNLIKKKIQLRADVQNDQASLYQYDIEQMKLYLNQIQQYPRNEIIMKTDERSSCSSNSNAKENDEDDNDDDDDDDDDDEDIDYPKKKTKKKPLRVMQFHALCPLTHLGIYGLDDTHDTRLCPPENKQTTRHLFSHLHGYHRLTTSLSYQLTKAVINKLDPLTTYLFLPQQKITDNRFDVIGCPLHRLKLANCKKRLLRDSLKLHLVNVHRLTLATSNKIVETVKNKGDITKLDFDEDEFK